MAEIETLTIKAGGKVMFAHVVGGLFDRNYRVHIRCDTCVILADWETGEILLEEEKGEARQVPFGAIKVVP